MVNHITALNPHVIYQTFTDQNEASTTTGLNYFMSELRAVAAGSKMKIKSMDHNFRATASTQMIGNTGSHKATSPRNSQTRLQQRTEGEE